MHSRKKRSSSWLGRKYLIVGRMLKVLGFTKGILASKRLENLLPRNAIKTYNCYQYLFIDWKTTTYNSNLVIIDLHNEPMQILINAFGLLEIFITFNSMSAPRLSLYLWVIVRLVLFLSLTAITTYAFSI